MRHTYAAMGEGTSERRDELLSKARMEGWSGLRWEQIDPDQKYPEGDKSRPSKLIWTLTGEVP